MTDLPNCSIRSLDVFWTYNSLFHPCYWLDISYYFHFQRRKYQQKKFHQILLVLADTAAYYNRKYVRSQPFH